MTMLADRIDAVIGVDTHLDAHALELAAPTGAVLATTTVTNDAAGYAAAIGWARAHTPGPRVVVAVEGTRSYGAGLARALAAAGLAVVEVERPRRAARRRGKTDAGDAHLAALAALRTDDARLAMPRADGPREALRILLGARHELTDTRTRQANRLRALLLTGDDTDRALRAGALTLGRCARIARRRGAATESLEARVRRAEARRLALAVAAATRTLLANKAELRALVAELAPTLLAAPGVGPVSAAEAIVAFSHRGRCRNEAAFAALAGACPVPASSGRTQRHRLNRGGDRRLNRALHDIAQARLRCCPRTKAYLVRRTIEGKSRPEIRRELKRYIARELFRTLQACMA